jgi:predicted transcriptional regulator
MTHVERNHLETYLQNINNLIVLKKALEESLDWTKYELDIAMSWFGDHELDEVVPDEEIINAPSELYIDHHLDQYTDTVKRVMEEILPCLKLIENK